MLPEASVATFYALALFHADCSLAVAFHTRFHGLAEVHVDVDIVKYKNSFEIYGKCSVQTSIAR